MIIIYGITLAIIGFVQVIAALIRLLVAKRQSSTYAIKLKQYLVSVAIYFFINYLLLEFKIPESYLFSYLFIIPPFFAFWYWRHVNNWAKKYKRIKAFDKMQREKNNHHLPLEVPCQERLDLDKHPKRIVTLVNWNNKLKVAH